MGKTEVRNAIGATCVSEGYTGDTYCLDCNALISSGKVIEKTAHTETVINAKEATCSETGYTGDTVCSVCNTLISSGEEIERIDHTPSDWITDAAASATTKGSKHIECTVCGAILEIQTISATGETDTHTHNYTPVVTAPTCTEKGYTTYTCSCGYSYTGNETAATGHTYNDGVITTAATCTADGVRTYTCSRCGDTRTETVPAAGHNYVDGVCTVCYDSDFTFSENSDGTYTVTGYNGSDTEITIPSTYKGVKVTAIGASAFKNNKTITSVTIGDNVTTIGSNAFYYCTALKSVTIGDGVESIGGGTFSACTALGTVTLGVGVTKIWDYAFGSCNAITTINYAGTKAQWSAVTIGANGNGNLSSAAVNYHYGSDHTYGEGVVTAPTCTKDGYTTYTCTGCDYSYTADETSATGHNNISDWIVDVKVTCVNAGSKHTECKDCGAIIEIMTEPALGKDHVYVKTVVAPTCTDDGYTEYTCAYCGEGYTANPVAATGHTPQWSAAYCGETYHWAVCTTCGEKVEKAEHTLTTVPAKVNYTPKSGHPKWVKNVTSRKSGQR